MNNTIAQTASLGVAQQTVNPLNVSVSEIDNGFLISGYHKKRIQIFCKDLDAVKDTLLELLNNKDE